jgi:type I restriction enzyme S subunit
MELKPGYKQTDAGIIPEDWDVKPIGAVLRKGRLGGNYSNQHRETNYPLIKMGNLARGYIDTAKVEYITSGVKPDLMHKLSTGDVLFNTRNTLDLVGKVAIWRDELPVAYYNSNLMRLEFDVLQVVSNEYACSALNTSGAVANLRALATGTTSVAAIYTRDLMQMPFVVPSPQEQRAIAKTLGHADALLNGLELLIAKKRDLKQATAQQLLTGQTRLPGFTGEWVIRQLGDEIADLESGISVNSVGEEMSGSSDRFAVLKTSAVADGQFLPSESKAIAPKDLKRVKLSLKRDTVIISRMNTIDLVGACGYVPADFPHLFVPDRLWMTRFTPRSGVYAKWLALILSTPLSKSLLGSIATGTSGSMKNIGKKKFLGLKFAFPSPNEQMAIADALADFDSEIAALEQRLAKTRDIKQGMMQELLTGKTRLITPEALDARTT